MFHVRSDSASKTGLDFQRDAALSIRRVRSLLTQVVSRIPDLSYRRPHDLAGALDMDAKLAWRIGRCMEEPDPFAAAQLLPGPAGLKTFLRAVARRQVPAELVESLRESVDQFCSMVRVHAGSRKNFNRLATGVTESQRTRFDTEHRKTAFEGNSYIWGVHARTIFRCYLIQPSKDGQRWDLIAIRGFIDFCRLRPKVAWRISSPATVDNDHEARSIGASRALDPRANEQEDSVPLLTDFCTEPLPKFRPVAGPLGGRDFEFVADSVGRSSQMSVVTGEIMRQVEPRFRQEQYENLAMLFPIRLPAEVLILDLLLHRDLFPDTQPVRAELYGDLFGGGPNLRYEESDLLPLQDSVQHLGTGTEFVRCVDIPRYFDMVNYCTTQAGWNGEAFQVFRLRLQFPPIPATAVVRRPLPPAP